jgi:hypothetical protein
MAWRVIEMEMAVEVNPNQTGPTHEISPDRR